MRIVIVGGSAAGTFTALLLARAGHQVIVLDRDPLEPAADVEASAATAFRAAAPQVVQPHGMIPLCRELLMQRLPDVHAQLLEAGAVEVPLDWQLPPTMPNREPKAGDERITMLPARRSTLDWVLRRALAAEPGVDERSGVRVTGLTAEAGRPPRVTGVHTAAGDIAADLVIDASGRRTAIDRWLAGIGAAQTELLAAECGLSYHSRHYRLRTTEGLPGRPTTRQVVSLDEFNAGIWGTDNGAVILAVAPLVEDKRFARLVEPEVHEAVLRLVPQLAPWLDVLEPMSPIYPMGGLHNTYRRIVIDDELVATGLLPVGDSVCTTNPTFGRGLALALVTAVEVADAIGQGRPIRDTGLDYAARLQHKVEPYFHDQAANDEERLAALRHAIFGAPLPERVTHPDRVSFVELRTAAGRDADLFRAMWRLLGMLQPLEEVYTDPAVVARTREVLATPPTVAPPPKPTREQLELTLALS